MRPLTGVVIKIGSDKIKGGWMKIELESGNAIITKRIKGIERGDKVEVFYDFTKDRVGDVKLFGEKDESHLVEPQFPEIDIPEPLETEPESEDIGDQPIFDPELEEWEELQEKLEVEQGAPSFPKNEGYE